ncbi:MAG: secretin N-terminal domain-containing protein [Planctomycetota bacterium]
MERFVRTWNEVKVLMLVALIMVTGTLALAQEEAEPTEQKEVLTSLELRMQKRITVDFRELPIDDVLRIIAEQADVDIVKSPKVTGNVTAKLTKVPLEEALRNILAAHGYGYVTDENMIRIAPTGEISQAAETLVSRIWRITYADVAEVEKALEKFKSPRGTVSSNPGTSNIIVTDTENKIKAIDTFIEEIDRITDQILVEARIYDITAREDYDLGVTWQAGRNTAYPFELTTIGGVSWPSGDVEDSAVTARDISRQQAFNPLVRRDPFLTGGFDIGGPAAYKTGSATGIFRFGWLNESIDLDLMLTAQKENVNAKLLANPRIMVLDNEQATFDIVTEEPYVERTITGSQIIETIKFKPIGVKLNVTPHVARDGMLRLHIAPEFGVLVGRVALTAGNVPIVDTRKVNTIALVQDGQTVVLGGLRKKDATKQVNKVPFLGDIPLIGMLFRFTGEATAITELVVFLTPKIVEQPIVMSEAESQAYETTNFRGPRMEYTDLEKKNEEPEPEPEPEAEVEM